MVAQLPPAVNSRPRRSWPPAGGQREEEAEEEKEEEEDV